MFPMNPWRALVSVLVVLGACAQQPVVAPHSTLGTSPAQAVSVPVIEPVSNRRLAPRTIAAGPRAPDEFQGTWVTVSRRQNPVIRGMEVRGGQANITGKLPDTPPFTISVDFVEMRTIDGEQFAIFEGFGGRRIDTCAIPRGARMTCTTMEDNRGYGTFTMERESPS